MIAVILAACGAIAALPAQSLEGRVNAAVDRGVAHLVSRQNADGSFAPPDQIHPLGRTALTLLALVHSGLPESHPAVVKGLEFIGVRDGYTPKIQNKSTYETGILILLLHALGRKGYREPIHELAQWLVERFDHSARLWGYPTGERDLSNTQYAVLGLRAAMDRGFKTPAKIWLALIDRLADTQDKEGGFRYRGDSLPTGSMTHAGLCVLLFAAQALGTTAPESKIKPVQKRAQQWAEERYSVEHNPMGRGSSPGDGWYHYYLYGLERYAVFYGLKKIGDHDWYAEGAEVLLRLQNADGGWGNFEQTSFALLFLRKAAFTPSTRKAEPPSAESERPPAPKPPPADPPPPPPSPDVPFLREWLVAGPFPSPRGQDDMLATSHLNEARLAPESGELAGKGKWVQYASPEDRVDLAKATKASDYAAWYAFTWIRADEEKPAVLWLGSDDGCRVYLNGTQVFEGHHHDGSGPDRYRVPLALKKGRNRLLIKVENLGYFVNFVARITTPYGLTDPGLTVSPDARKVR